MTGYVRRFPRKEQSKVACDQSEKLKDDTKESGKKDTDTDKSTNL